MARVEDSLEQAKKLLREGKCREACELFSEIRQNAKILRPDQNEDLLYHYAMALKAIDRRGLAEKCLRDLYHEAHDRERRELECKAVHELGTMALEENRYSEAIKLYREELTLWYSGMEHYFAGLALNYLAQGNCCLAMGHTPEAQMYLKHAVTYAHTGQDARLKGRALAILADLQLRDGKRKEATKLLRQALSSLRQDASSEEIPEIEKQLEKLEKEAGENRSKA